MKNLDIQTIALVCMPNGKLGNVYGNKVISAGSAGKTRGKSVLIILNVKDLKVWPINHLELRYFLE